MRVPAGVCRMAFSTKLASICVSSSRSPRKVDRRLDLGVEALAGVLGGGREGIDHVAKTALRSRSRKPERRVPASICAMRSSAPKIAENLVDLGDGRLDGGVVFFDRLRPRLRRFQPLAQPRQRGLQIVRDIGRDLLQAFHQLGDAVEHPVQGEREPVEIVTGAAHRHALREIAGDDRLRRAPDRLDALEKARLSAMPPMTAERDHRGKGRRETVEDGLFDLVDLLAVGGDCEAHRRR